EHRATDVRTMSLSVVSRRRSAESIELGNATREGRMRTRGRALVEAGISNADYLAVALVGRPVHYDVCVQDRPRDVVAERDLWGLLDYAHSVDLGDVVEVFLPHSEPNLPATHGQCILIDSRGGRDRGPQSVGPGVNVVVEDDVDGARRVRVRCGGGHR